MKPYGQQRALGFKATAAVNDGKRHRCGLDAGDLVALGLSDAAASKHKTRAHHRSVERQAAKLFIKQELA